MEAMLVSVKEAADSMGVSVATFYKLMNRAEHPIPTVKLGANRVKKGGSARRLVSVDALKVWIAEEAEKTMKGRN